MCWLPFSECLDEEADDHGRLCLGCSAGLAPPPLSYLWTQVRGNIRSNGPSLPSLHLNLPVDQSACLLLPRVGVRGADVGLDPLLHLLGPRLRMGKSAGTGSSICVKYMIL